MLENRSQYRRLLRAVSTLVLLIVYGLIFWLTWHKYYSPRMERMFWRKGHLLIVTSPIMLLVALAIKLEDHGCVFYKQERLTINRKPFYIYKFRSMKEDAEQDGKYNTTAYDR